MDETAEVVSVIRCPKCKAVAGGEVLRKINGVLDLGDDEEFDISIDVEKMNEYVKARISIVESVESTFLVKGVLDGVVLYELNPECVRASGQSMFVCHTPQSLKWSVPLKMALPSDPCGHEWTVPDFVNGASL